MTNAEWIRSMSDDELATWLCNICTFVSSDNEGPYLSVLTAKRMRLKSMIHTEI